MSAVCTRPCITAQEMLGSFWCINGIVAAHAEGCLLGVLPLPEECWECLPYIRGLCLPLRGIWDSGCLSTDSI